MDKINWTELSLQDIENIAEYISLDSERYAELTVFELYKSTEILEKFPTIGRIVPEFKNKKIREIIKGNFRIIYKIINENRIDILTVYHSKRKLKRKNRSNNL